MRQKSMSTKSPSNNFDGGQSGSEAIPDWCLHVCGQGTHKRPELLSSMVFSALRAKNTPLLQIADNLFGRLFGTSLIPANMDIR